MAKSINRIEILGNVGNTIEIRSTGGGVMVATFQIATSDRFKDQSGKWQDRIEWHNMVAFKRNAEIIRDYVKKGSKLPVDGKLQTRCWDDKDSGKKMYRAEIIVNDLILLTPSDKNQAEPASDASSNEAPQGSSSVEPENTLQADEQSTTAVTEKKSRSRKKNGPKGLEA